MTRKYILALLLGIGGMAPAFAQLSGSVSVEGEYEPIVVESERLNTFPQGFRFELPAANLQYETEGIVSDYKPGILTMGVTGRQAERDWRVNRGFIDFRIGSYLNSRLHAGYTVLADSVNSLSADLKFTSSTLYRAGGGPDNFTRLPRKRFYEGELGLDYSRLIGAQGLLSSSFGYRVGYFNYYGTTTEGTMLPSGNFRITIPSQTVNCLDYSVGYSSSPSILEGWHAEGSVGFLAYRRLYSPLYGFDPFIDSDFRSQRGDRETELKLGGGYAFPFAENSALALDADGDFLFYTKRRPVALPSETVNRNNYGVITLTPAYMLENEGLMIRAGADFIFSYNAMGREPGKHFGGFHVAPDVAVEYGSTAGVGIFLTATGGVTPSTLMLKQQWNRYQMPWELSTLPVFSPVDARFGLNFGPFVGFTGEIGFRYAVAKNTPLGGWYQEYLGAWVPGFELDRSLYCDPYAQSLNLHGFALDLKLQYAFGSMLNVEFNTTYTPQNGKKGIFNGFDRPRWILEAKAGVTPVKRLNIDLGYEYRGVRNCYAWQSAPDGNRLASLRLPDLSYLNLRAGYKLIDFLEVYCQLDNILNRRVDILPGLKSEGIVISGGFHITF